LLLRSTEIQPAVSKIRALRAPLLSYSPSSPNFNFYRLSTVLRPPRKEIAAARWW